MDIPVGGEIDAEARLSIASRAADAPAAPLPPVVANYATRLAQTVKELDQCVRTGFLPRLRPAAAVAADAALQALAALPAERRPLCELVSRFCQLCDEQVAIAGEDAVLAECFRVLLLVRCQSDCNSSAWPWLCFTCTLLLRSLLGCAFAG